MKDKGGKENKTERLLIFGGTTEGRELAEVLLSGEAPYELHICVTSAYAAKLLPADERLSIHVGRLDADEMTALIKRLKEDRKALLCIDATHPYAVEAGRNIREACKRTKVKYERIKRDTKAFGNEDKATGGGSSIIYVDSVDEAAEYLRGTKEGNIFIATGSKELVKYRDIPDFEKRAFARVLPNREGIESCERAGLTGKHIIAMQGPFCEEINYALLMASDAEYMVTKQSGDNGGYAEKLYAARSAGVKLIVVGTPTEYEKYPQGKSFEEILSELCPKKRKGSADGGRKLVYIVGIGPGGVEMCTTKAVKALKDADVIIGAERVVEAAKKIEKTFGKEDKPVFISYKPEEITHFIDTHGEYRRIAMVYSGDIGFYSGARKLSELLEASPEKYKTVRISGISSPVYLLNKLSVDITKVFMSSMHGKKQELLEVIRKSDRFCIIVGDKKDIQKICDDLIRLGFPNATVYVGEKLSYPDERISAGTPEKIRNMEFDRLSVVYVELS